MIIGVPKEVKNGEYRVGITVNGVKELLSNNHKVYVLTNAGVHSGFSDEDYKKAGAEIIDDVEKLWGSVDVIMKVKEPQKEEYPLMREGLIIYTYLHLASNLPLTKRFVESKAIGIAYETITEPSGGTPGNRPMSEIAGRLAVQTGMWLLTKAGGGSGTLLSGTPGIPRGKVLIIGGGDVGQGAIKIATGIGASVTVVDRWLPTLKKIEEIYGARIKTRYAQQSVMSELTAEADLIIGAVAIRGDATPILITKEMVKNMKVGSVIVDVAIDQGGCSETSKPTTHEKPTYVTDGVIHYCVPNMPGTVCKSSTVALTNTTIQYIIEIANKGWKKACLENKYLRDGLNTAEGMVTLKPVADVLNQKYKDAKEICES